MLGAGRADGWEGGKTNRNKPEGMVGTDALVRNGAGLNKHLEK